MVAPVEVAWWSLETLQHAGSLLLILLVASHTGLPTPSWAGRLAAWTDERLRRWSLRHAALLGVVVVAGGIVLHAFTLRHGGVGNYGDLHGWWVPGAEATLSGGNPYAPPPGEDHGWSNALNYGIVFPALLAAGYALAGELGLVAVLVAFASLVPPLAFLLMRELTPDPASPLPGYAALLSVTLPQSLYFQVWGVQDELVTVVALLATLGLVMRDRVLWAGLVAGLGAGVKYLPLPFLALLLALWWRAGSGRMVRAVGSLAVAGGTFAAGVGLGVLLYGRDFLRRTLGMGELLTEPRTVTLADSLAPVLDPGLMTLAAGLAFLALLAHLALGRAGADPRGVRYPGAVVAGTGMLLLLFPKANPDFVTFAIVPGLLLLVARWDALEDATPGWDLLWSPLLVYGLGALADLLLKLRTQGGFEGKAPLPVEVAFTLLALALVVLGARWHPWMAHREEASQRRPAISPQP